MYTEETHNMNRTDTLCKGEWEVCKALYIFHFGLQIKLMKLRHDLPSLQLPLNERKPENNFSE